MLLSSSEEALVELNAIYTQKEILQQPQKWRDLADSLVANKSAIEKFMQRVKQPGLRVILTGAGTSEFAGKAITLHLNEICDYEVSSVATTDIVSNPSQYLDAKTPTLIVSFARSGNSPESVATVELANEMLEQVYHLVLTCNGDGSLAKACGLDDNSLCVLMPEGTNDVSFAMTSSCTSMQMAALIILSDSIDKCRDQVGEIASVCERNREKMHALASEIAQINFERLVYIGSGDLKGTAQESALKLLELTAGKIVTYFDSALGFRHGPKFIANEKSVAVHMLSGDEHSVKYDSDLVNELSADDIVMKVVTVSATENQYINSPLSLNLDVKNLKPVWLNFPYLMFAQMLGFEKSVNLGLSPDNPCPSGEVNRVVRGVIIHK